MFYLSTVGSLALIALILADTFETMLLPRRIIHQFRFVRGCSMCIRGRPGRPWRVG